jgi:hypothetical protein
MKYHVYNVVKMARNLEQKWKITGSNKLMEFTRREFCGSNAYGITWWLKPL